MIELIKEGKTLQAVASELYVPEDLLLIALEDFRSVHPELKLDLPRPSKGNYLKDYDPNI